MLFRGVRVPPKAFFYRLNALSDAQPLDGARGEAASAASTLMELINMKNIPKAIYFLFFIAVLVIALCVVLIANNRRILPERIEILNEITETNLLQRISLYGFVKDRERPDGFAGHALFLIDEKRDLLLSYNGQYPGYDVDVNGSKQQVLIAVLGSDHISRDRVFAYDNYHTENEAEIPLLIKRLYYKPTREYAMARLVCFGEQAVPHLTELLDSNFECINGTNTVLTNGKPETPWWIDGYDTRKLDFGPIPNSVSGIAKIILNEIETNKQLSNNQFH